jgi:hypothetical protein
MLFFDNFYVFDNGVYGIYTEGTNSGFTNFQIERNGTARYTSQARMTGSPPVR